LLLNSTKEDHQKLAQAVRGIVFFGVPHGGMDVSSLIPIVKDQPNRFLLESIGINSQVLSNQQREFDKAIVNHEVEVFCFYETALSPTAVKVCFASCQKKVSWLR
jgi:protein SERAC1